VSESGWPISFEEFSRFLGRAQDGDIQRDHDLEALHATLSALSRGYRICRIPIAKRMGISAKELDSRVTGIVRIWLKAMAHSPDNSPRG